MCIKSSEGRNLLLSYIIMKKMQRFNGCGIIKASVFKWVPSDARSRSCAAHGVKSSREMKADWWSGKAGRLTSLPSPFMAPRWAFPPPPPLHILSCDINSSTLMQKWKTPLVPIRGTWEQLEEKLVSAWLTAFNINSPESEAGIQTQWCH